MTVDSRGGQQHGGAPRRTAEGPPRAETDAGVSVAVASGTDLMATGLAAVLERAGFRAVVIVASDAMRAVGAAADSGCDVVAIDGAIADVVAAVLRLAAPNEAAAPVVAFNVRVGTGLGTALLRAGALGVADETTGVAELVEMVRAAVRGQLVLQPSLAREIIDRLAGMAATGEPVASARQMTPRELEIAELLAAGCSNKQIAASLSIEVATVKNHVHHVLGKLGVRHRGEVQAAAVGVLRERRRH